MNETIEIGPIVVEDKRAANVGFSASYTKNLGNYESVKVTVSLFYPVTVKGEEFDAASLDEVMSKVTDWVDQKMGDTVATLSE